MNFPARIFLLAAIAFHAGCNGGKDAGDGVPGLSVSVDGTRVKADAAPTVLSSSQTGNRTFVALQGGWNRNVGGEPAFGLLQSKIELVGGPTGRFKLHPAPTEPGTARLTLSATEALPFRTEVHSRSGRLLVERIQVSPDGVVTRIEGRFEGTFSDGDGRVFDVKGTLSFASE